MWAPSGITAPAFVNHLAFAVALILLSALLTHLMYRRVRIIDVPNARSSHDVPTPKSGGIAIVATFSVGVLIMVMLGNNPLIRERYFIGFVISALLIAAVALYDDIKSKPFIVKLAAQLLGIGLALSLGIVIDVVTLPVSGAFALGAWAYPLSFFWMFGMTNAFNFMDGIDGLAAGVAVIVSAFFCAITYSQGSTLVYITSYTLLAGSIGFLIYNAPPARIFMGDVGSAFLGFAFAVLAIIAARYDQAHTSFMVMPLLLFNFIYDTVFTFIRRLFRGDRVLDAHRTHLYQLVNRLGYSHRAVSFMQYAMCVTQGIAAVWMVSISGAERMLVFLPFLFGQIAYSYLVIKSAQKAQLL
jgi:UDP-GlcNAc:undecaprenyl-phosphate/decaprenyl-phosphate GlcNAc-1-phosphate transferase